MAIGRARSGFFSSFLEAAAWDTGFPVFLELACTVALAACGAIAPRRWKQIKRRKFMKFAKLAILATALAATPIAASAQDVGATVYGNDGNPIGTIDSNDGTNAVVNTGKYTAALPVSAFGTSENGPTLNITKAQIEEQLAAAQAQQEAAMAEAQAAAEAEAAAALAAALVVGAPVITADQQALGMVEEIAGENVIIKSEEDSLITLPLNLLAANPEGGLFALANFDDIMAAVQAVGG
jgi:hypothetical protein